VSSLLFMIRDHDFVHISNLVYTKYSTHLILIGLVILAKNNILNGLDSRDAFRGSVVKPTGEVHNMGQRLHKSSLLCWLFCNPSIHYAYQVYHHFIVTTCFGPLGPSSGD
jgi:hypothetical protein